MMNNLAWWVFFISCAALFLFDVVGIIVEWIMGGKDDRS